MAVAARTADIAALGVDMEPAEPLPPEVAEIALFGAERRDAASDPALAARSSPPRRRSTRRSTRSTAAPLEYEDIDVDFGRRKARLRDGRWLALTFATDPRIVVGAFIVG